MLPVGDGAFYRKGFSYQLTGCSEQHGIAANDKCVSCHCRVGGTQLVGNVCGFGGSELLHQCGACGEVPLEFVLICRGDEDEGFNSAAAKNV